MIATALRDVTPILTIMVKHCTDARESGFPVLCACSYWASCVVAVISKMAVERGCLCMFRAYLSILRDLKLI